MATLSPGRRQQQQRQQHSQTSTAPTTSSFFAPTSASASASFVPSRSKPKLPFPLPDPYDDSANFVVHDPRGLFTRRRRESSASERSSASALSGLSSSRLGSAVSDQGSQGSETALAGGSEGEEAINGIGNSISALSLALAEHTTSELGISHETESPIPFSVSPSPSPTSASISSLSATYIPFTRSRMSSIGSSSEQHPYQPSQPTTAQPISITIQPTISTQLQGEGAEEGFDSQTSSPFTSVASPALNFLSSLSDSTSSKSLDFLNGKRGNPFALTSRFAPDAEGFHINGYILGKEIGRGGFGVVREARKMRDDAGEGEEERIAVKVVKHSEPQRESGYGTGGGRRRMSENRRIRDIGGGEQRNRSSSTPLNLNTRSLSSSSLSAANVSPSRSPTPSAINVGDDFTRSITPHQILLAKEISIWKSLAPHPHIVPLLAVHQAPQYTYIFMPLCEGGNLLGFINSRSTLGATARRGRKSMVESMTLASTTEEDSPRLSDAASGGTKQHKKGLPLSTILPIFAQIVAGLHYLHTEAGIVHKDLKLENILSDEEGGGGTWRIADFGLAESEASLSAAAVVDGGDRRRESSESEISGLRRAGTMKSTIPSSSPSSPFKNNDTSTPLSRSQSLSHRSSSSNDTNSTTTQSSHHPAPAGSLPYSPPEQMKSSIPVVHPSVDIWALGCVLYACVAGSLPFEDGFEPRLRMKILRGAWEVPTALLASTSTSPSARSTPPPATVPRSPGSIILATVISPNGTGGAGGGRERGGGGDRREEVEKRLILDVLKGCLELDLSKRWTIERVKACEWLNEDRNGRRGRTMGGGAGMPYPSRDLRESSSVSRTRNSSRGTTSSSGGAGFEWERERESRSRIRSESSNTPRTSGSGHRRRSVSRGASSGSNRTSREASMSRTRTSGRTGGGGGAREASVSRSRGTLQGNEM